MAKKQKKQQRLLERNRSKIRQLCRRLDWVCLLLGILIALAAVGTLNSDYDLGKANPQGFAMWFLLFLGWGSLELAGVVSWIFGLQQELSPLGEGPTLGFCALTTLIAVWAVLRFWVSRRFSPELLKTAIHFILIIACWGLFQLFCYLIALGCERSDVAPLDRQLRKSAPGGRSEMAVPAPAPDKGKADRTVLIKK